MSLSTFEGISYWKCSGVESLTVYQLSAWQYTPIVYATSHDLLSTSIPASVRTFIAGIDGISIQLSSELPHSIKSSRQLKWVTVYILKLLAFHMQHLIGPKYLLEAEANMPYLTPNSVYVWNFSARLQAYASTGW